MANAGTVDVKFAADVIAFNKQLASVSTSLTGLNKSFSTFGDIANRALGFLSGAALVAFAKQALVAADAIGDAASRAGTTVEAFSRLKFAAEQSDIQFESLEVAIRKFQDTLAEAAHGSQQAAAAFNDLGVSAESLKGKDLETQLGIIADRFKEIQDPADRVRIAIDLFGRSGNELVPLLAKGSEGLKELAAQAEKLGVVLDTQTAQALDRAENKLKTLGDQAVITSAKIFDLLSITFTGAPTEALAIDQQIRFLQQRKTVLDAIVRDSRTPPIGAVVELRELNTQLDALIAKQERAAGTGVGGADTAAAILGRLIAKTATLPDVQAPTFSIALTPEEESKQLLEIAGTLDKVNQLKLDAANQEFEFEFQLRQDTAASLDAIDQQANQLALQRIKEREQAILDSERIIRQERTTTTELAIGLLQAFAGRSRAAAIAAIALGKALSIAQAIQNTAVAFTKALAIDPTGALAARVALLGKIQIGIIAATGLAEISQVGSGGAALGTPANPIFSRGGAASEDQIPGATGQTVTQIIINGNAFSSQQTVDWMLESIKDAIDNRDFVVINPNGNSAQAQLLGG